MTIAAPATIASVIELYRQNTDKDLSSMEVRLNGELVSDLDIPVTSDDKIYLSSAKSGA